jgi:hypothetical protein
LLGASLVAGVIPTLLALDALRSFSAEDRACGIAVIGVLRADAPHVATTTAMVAAIVRTHQASIDDTSPLGWRAWGPFMAIPAAAVLSSLVSFVAVALTILLVEGNAFEACKASVGAFARASDAGVGLSLSLLYALCFSGAARVLLPLVPRSWRLRRRLLLGWLFAGVGMVLLDLVWSAVFAAA